MASELIKDSKLQTAALISQVRAVNGDLNLRAEAEGIEINYSREDDYLRVQIGKPRESVALTTHDGPLYVAVLVEPDSAKISALEVPFFLELATKMRKNSRHYDFWKMIEDIVRASDEVTAYIPPRQTWERAGRALAELSFV